MTGEIKTIEISELIPKDWVDNDGKYYLVQSVYQCLFFDLKEHHLPYLKGIIEDVVYVVINLAEGIKYDSFTTEWTSDNNGAFITANVAPTITPNGTHIIFFTKYKEGGVISEIDAKAKIEGAVGLVGSVEGRNSSFKHRFSNTITFPGGLTNQFSMPELSPASFPKPFSKIDRLSEISLLINKTDPNLKNKILLALRWFEKSERDTDPLDSFLKVWFALEVLAMPDTNIKPVVEMLAKIYGRTYEESIHYFRIGPIHGLRSRIVHNGEVATIHYMLTDFLKAVFVDILFFLINAPSEKRSESIISDTSMFSHEQWRP